MLIEERIAMKQIWFILFAITPLLAETVVSGIILKNEWWSRDKSPYVVTNDILIGPDARLVIEPGVEILVEKPLKLPDGISQVSQADTFSTSIRIHGALRCIGTADQPIIFRGKYVSKGDEYTHWEGITLKTKRSDEIFIAYTQIHNASTALRIEKGDPLIRNTLFEKNSVGIKVTDGSSPRIVNSLFTDNFLCGLKIEKANPEVYNSIFFRNRNIALWGDHVSKIKFKYNGLYGNGDKNFVNCSPELGAVAEVNKNNDSSDVHGNLFLDPIFVGSTSEKNEKAKRKEELLESSIRKPSQRELMDIETAPRFSEGRKFFLSKFSPYINAGNPASQYDEPDGSHPDLGIWGGPEFLK